MYRVAPELSAIEFPARRYERLVALVVDALPERARHDRMREIGVAFGRELANEMRLRSAKTLDTALGALCAALGRLGYQASVAEISEEQAVIRTPTCPLRPLVRVQPRLAELDRGMWAALLARTLAAVGVDEIACHTHDCQHEGRDCRVVLTLQPGRAGRAHAVG